MNSHDSSTNQPDGPSYRGLLPDSHEQVRPGEPASEDMGQRVDQVAVRKLGGFNFLDPAQWVSMPREERMRLIKSGSVLFLFQGEEVPLRPALVYLQALSSPEQARITRPTENPGFDLGSARPGEV